MSETDFLNDLLSSNPNEPAPKGLVLLLRTEMKSEFKAVRSEIAQVSHKLDSLTKSVELIAQQLGQIARQVGQLVNQSH